MPSRLGVAALLIAVIPGVAPAQTVAEPEGYREAPYKGATPAGLSGAMTVDTDAAHALWEAGEVLFIDAMPRSERPADLPAGTIWRDPPRDSIPGAAWLANVGYAALPAHDEAYFRSGLASLTDGDPEQPILFFCREECWMSWNAGKRALALGYTDVYWYPEGTDGWTRAGHPIEPVEPLELR